MDVIKLNIGGFKFTSTKRTLEYSEHFSAIINHTNFSSNDEIFIDRDPDSFKHVLNYMRDPKYPFPIQYLYELDFYDVKYPKYNKNTPDIVTINTRGKEFKLKANIMMKGSTYLDKKLSELYVGQVLYLDDSPQGFKHIIERIYNETHIVPMEYGTLKVTYDVQKLKITNNGFMKVYVDDGEFNLKVELLIKIPKMKELIDQYECIPRLSSVNKKAFKNVIEVVTSEGFPIKKYKYAFEFLGLNPPRYYNKEYNKCCKDSCDTYFKNIKSADGWSSGSNYCTDHRCLLCKKRKESKWSGDYYDYCEEHMKSKDKK